MQGDLLLLVECSAGPSQVCTVAQHFPRVCVSLPERTMVTDYYYSDLTFHARFLSHFILFFIFILFFVRWSCSNIMGQCNFKTHFRNNNNNNNIKHKKHSTHTQGDIVTLTDVEAKQVAWELKQTADNGLLCAWTVTTARCCKHPDAHRQKDNF